MTRKGKKGGTLAFPRLQSIGLVHMKGSVRGIGDGVRNGGGRLIMHGRVDALTYIYVYRHDRIMKTSVAKKVLDHALRRGIVEVRHCALCVLSPYDSEEHPSSSPSKPIVIISMPTYLHTHTTT